MADHFGTISIEPKPRASAPVTSKKGSQKKQEKPAEPKKKGVFFIALIFLLGIFSLPLLYLGYGYYLAPKHLAHYLQKQVDKLPGTTLSHGAIDFDPIGLTLSVADLRFNLEQQIEPLLSFDSFFIDLAILPLFQKEFVATKVDSENLIINIARQKEGIYNFSHLLKSSAKEDNSASTTISDFTNLFNVPYRFSINNINISKSQIFIRDTPNNKTHTIDKIELSLPTLSNFSYQASNYIRPQFSAVINGSPIELTGEASISGNNQEQGVLKTNLSCNFNNIEISQYINYLPLKLPFTFTKGTTDGRVQFNFNPSVKGKELLVNFSMQPKDVEIVATDESYRLAVPSAKVEGDIHPLTQNSRFTNIVLRDPQIHASQPFSIDQLSNILGSSKVPSTSQSSPTQSGFRVDLLIADNGSFSVENPKDPTSKGSWRGIHLNLKNFSRNINLTKMSKATFRISADHGKSQGSFSWQGTLDQHNLPSGNLQLDNFNANVFFDWFNLKQLVAQKGEVDATGLLQLKRDAQSHKSQLVFTEGKLTFDELTLKDDQVWYSAPVTKLTGFSAENGRISLGNIHLNNSTANIDLSSPPPLFSILASPDSKIEIDAVVFKGALKLKHSEKSPPLDVTDISLQAINLSSPSDSPERDNITIKAQLPDGGKFQAKGTVKLKDLNLTLNAGWSQCNASQLLSLVSKGKLARKLHAKFSGKGLLTYPAISFKGQLQLDKGKLTQKSAQPLKFGSVLLHDFHYNASPFQFKASLFEVKKPKVDLRLNQNSTHFITALASYLKNLFPQSTTGTSNKTPFLIELEKVTFHNGNIQLRDKRLTPQWDGSITDFTGSLDGVTVGKDHEISPFTFTGKLDTVPFTLSGQLFPHSITRKGQAELTIDDYPLPSFHEQLASQLDIDSSRGSFSVQTTTQWENDSIKQASSLVMSNVEPLSEKSESALTLALLNNTEYKFDIQVEQDIAISEKTRPLFLEALTSFRKYMAMSAVSPLFLGDKKFADLAGKEFAEFVPGQIKLSAEGQESLTRFSQFLSTHPLVGILITGSADTNIDRKALQKELEQLEHKRVKKINEKQKEAIERYRQEQLEKLSQNSQAGENRDIASATIPVERLAMFTPVLPEPVIIEDDDLRTLALNRAQAIADFFINRLALQPERVTISNTPRLTKDSTKKGNVALFTIDTFTQAEDDPTTIFDTPPPQ